MKSFELKLTNEDIKERLVSISPPVPISEDTIRLYNIAYMQGAKRAICLCHRDSVEREEPK